MTLIERAADLALPAASVDAPPVAPALPWTTYPGGARLAGPAPLVLDLSALWAGPLAASILVETGCRVVKVEMPGRLDGARRGPRAFFDLLNTGKEAVALDLAAPSDRTVFDSLLEAADVVITSFRPRVLHHLGLERRRFVESGGVWLSITAYGPGPWENRVGFGDDCAVAGGLVIVDDLPRFVGDAIADPIVGLAGAAAVLGSLAAGRGAEVDVALADVAAFARADGPAGGHVTHNGFTWAVASRGRRHDVMIPMARPDRGQGPAPDEHGPAVRRAYG